MRRGRPGKTAGALGGSKDGWAAFTSQEQDRDTNSTSASAPSGRGGGGGGGFGDAFVPTKANLSQSKSPEVPLATELEMPKNMGMFKDLASHKSEAQLQEDKEKKEKEADEERKKFESTFPASTLR